MLRGLRLGLVRLLTASIWFALAIAILIAAVSLMLSVWLSDIYESAVSESRLYAYAEDVDDESMLTDIAFLWSSLIVVWTLLLAVASAVVRRFHRAENALGVTLVLSAPLVNLPLALLGSMATDSELACALYAKWYVPLLEVGAVVHILLLTHTAKIHFGAVASRGSAVAKRRDPNG